MNVLLFGVSVWRSPLRAKSREFVNRYGMGSFSILKFVWFGKISVASRCVSSRFPWQI